MKDISQDIYRMDRNRLEKFVRSRLQFDEHELSQLRMSFDDDMPHRRFDMSGYGDGSGSCMVHNQGILNLFRDCGLYNHVVYFYLDAYKGSMTLYYSLWNGGDHESVDFSGMGTVDIIIEIIHILVTRPMHAGTHNRRVD